MTDTTQPEKMNDYAEALHEWRDLISDQKWAKWFKDAVTSALERAALAPVAVGDRQIADATNALRDEILATWPDFKPDVGRLRTIVSKHIVAKPPEQQAVSQLGQRKDDVGE